MIDPFAPPPEPAVVVGTGRLTLDVVVKSGDATIRAQAGGTCGNVLTNLACLGWLAYPLTDIGTDEPGRRYLADLRRWGVRLDLLETYSDQQTPIIVHQIRNGEHAFSSECPWCGGRLQYYEPVPLERVEQRLGRVPRADVFFFDRDSPGSLRLAHHCRQQAALVVYEPNYAGPESQLDEALAVADVLKYSRERLAGLADSRPIVGPSLVIETLGGDGLRYREWPSGTWQYLPAIPIPQVRDTGGSGDWCTAGFLHRLGRTFRTRTAEQVRDALRFGMALAAWNCAFDGARGGMYLVDRSTWQRDVRRLLSGEQFDPAAGAGPTTQLEAGLFCPHCQPESTARF